MRQHGNAWQRAWAYVGPAGFKGTAFFQASSLPKDLGNKFYFTYVGYPIKGESELFQFSTKPATPPSAFYLSTAYDLHVLHKEFTEADPDLTDDGTTSVTYKSAICTQGAWMVYSHKHFNDDTHAHQSQIIYEGQTIPLKFQPRSVRPLPQVPNSVTLFEHPQYGGTMQTLTESTDYLKDFPVSYDSHGHKNTAGVSSIYICGSKSWKFFTGPDHSGLPFILDPAFKRHYEDLSQFSGMDESIQSVQILD